MSRLSVLVCAVIAAAAPAGADSFDDAVAKAAEISANDLGVVLWASGGECTDARNDTDRLACREVAKAISARSATKTYYLSAEPSVTAGAYNKRKRSMPVELGSCLYCKGLDIGGGKKMMVVGRVDPSKGLEPLRQTTLLFPSRDEAKAWVQDSLPRLVGEFIFTIPAQVERFESSGHQGAYVNVASYRVYDPCTGKVAVSHPKLADVPANPKACGKPAAAAPSPEQE